MYDCWSDAETIEHFYKLNIKWSENKKYSLNTRMLGDLGRHEDHVTSL